jgi:hypothetical protein
LIRSKHCSLILFFSASRIGDEEVSNQLHSWCERLRAISQVEKVEALQIQSANSSSAFSRLAARDVVRSRKI